MRRQRGFTLAEIVVVMALAGLILPAVGTAIWQVSTGTKDLNNDYIIQNDIQLASSWFTRDLSQAQTDDLIDEGDPVDQIRMDWVDETGWGAESENASHYAEYSLSGTNMLRNYDGNVKTIATNISDLEFSRTGEVVTVLITSSIGEEARTLNYFVTRRPE
ncbi:type II secretion system protein J [Chloroflexota bacterium]